MKYLAAAILLAAAIAPALQVHAEAPKPAPVPANWQLDIDVQTPQAIQVQVSGETKPRTFWFARYTVSNHTGADQMFVPEFTLYTDTGQVLRAGQQVPTGVFDSIKSVLNDPLLKDPVSMTGRLLQGNDNAKVGVAIWSDFDPAAAAFDIFISGLSGETAEVTLPEPIKVEKVDASGKKTVVERSSLILTKALHLQYKVPGEAASRTTVKPSLVKQEWVMR